MIFVVQNSTKQPKTMLRDYDDNTLFVDINEKVLQKSNIKQGDIVIFINPKTRDLIVRFA
jgi:anaerobic selenocysteine-containing dehydrogenase